MEESSALGHATAVCSCLGSRRRWLGWDTPQPRTRPHDAEYSVCHFAFSHSGNLFQRTPASRIIWTRSARLVRPLTFEYTRNEHRRRSGRLLCFLLALPYAPFGADFAIARVLLPRPSPCAYVLCDCLEMHMLPAHTSVLPSARSLETK